MIAPYGSFWGELPGRELVRPTKRHKWLTQIPLLTSCLVGHVARQVKGYRIEAVTKSRYAGSGNELLRLFYPLNGKVLIQRGRHFQELVERPDAIEF